MYYYTDSCYCYACEHIYNDTYSHDKSYTNIYLNVLFPNCNFLYSYWKLSNVISIFVIGKFKYRITSRNRYKKAQYIMCNTLFKYI